MTKEQRRYSLQIPGQPTRRYEHLADAVGAAVLYTKRGDASYIYDGADALCEHVHDARHVWTLVAHDELWELYRKYLQPLGHLHSDDSLKPESQLPAGLRCKA